MKYYDRLYGELSFPPIIYELLNCPGLLRLRDVRMANNQFVSFPAFANASRYEHSLGVCYLAGLCAKSLELSEKDTIELMIACLYHDVGTPPFAHAMEEVLQIQFNFDHEENLRQIINGTNGSFEGNLEQVFLGSTTKLRSVCHSKLGRKSGLNLQSLYRIADIIVGKKEEVLSPLLNGNGMDLDNIDNVIRASSAMGIIDSKDTKLAIQLAQSFVFNDDNEICHSGFFINEIRRWQQIRDEQYTAIFESIDDFAYQTMIKKSLSLLLSDSDSKQRLNKDSWKLTDSSILYNCLLKNPLCRQIMQRVQLCKPFHCIGILYIKGNGVSKYINANIPIIEDVASDCFKEVLGLKDTDEKIKDLVTNVVVANFYPDKRKRPIYSKSLLFGTMTSIDEPNFKDVEGALLGLFTPLHNSNHKDVTGPDGSSVRRIVSFKQKDLDILVKRLKDQVFDNYDISLYGKGKK
ncbi:MAG: HD domain-containing protein [Clostridia bacterium]|nr:HD domain-containing protein [Clostridia bacterium]